MTHDADYDCGLINDYGGGDVSWWQDYVRAEIGRANDHWHEIIDHRDATIARLEAENERMREALLECEDYFDNRADAEWFPDSPRPVPNAEMTLLCVVRGALGASR
jgi:hypothetical protein